MTLSAEQAAILQILFKAKPELRHQLLKNADKLLVRTLFECCLNILEGNVPLNDKQKKKLSKQKSWLRKIAKKAGSWKQKRKILQRGGNLLIPILASVVGTLISSLL